MSPPGFQTESNTMKKIITSALALTAIAGAASAQSLVAGWDFSQVQSPNTTVAQGNLQGSWNANYTDRGVAIPSANYNDASAFGTVYWDGSFGSTVTDFNNFSGGAEVRGQTTANGVQNLTSNFNQSESPFNDASSYGFLTSSGQSVAQDAMLTFVDDVTITFALDAGTAKSNWSLLFAAQDSDTASFAIDASTTGAFAGEQTSFGTLNIDNTDNGYSVDFSSLGSTQELYVRFAATGASGGQLAIDNVGFAAAVPEPSTYAAILGFVALGFAAHRRRNA